MWIEFVRSGILCDFLAASSDDFVFLCRKCLRVRELEELVKECRCKDRWSVSGRPNASFMDRSVPEICPEASFSISTENRFSALEGLGEAVGGRDEVSSVGDLVLETGLSG